MSPKRRETAALMLWLGVILLQPPVALIFATDGRVFGIPLPVLYIFGVWLLLVVGALLVSRLFVSPESSD